MNTKQTQPDTIILTQTVTPKTVYFESRLNGDQEEKPTFFLNFTKGGALLAAILFFILPHLATSQTCTSPILNFTNPTLISGVAGNVGSVYRFNNVMTGANALVTIEAKSHSDIEIYMMDAGSVTYGGYNSAFQPIIDYNWINNDGTFDPAGEKSVTFNVAFVSSSTGIPIELNELSVTALDVDGSNDEVREFVETTGFQSYELQNNTTLTLSGALRAKGDIAVVPGIDETELGAMISFKYENRSSFTITIGGDYNGSTYDFADYDVFNTDEKRHNSIYMKCYNFNTSIECPSVMASGGGTYCSGEAQTLTATTSGGTGTCALQWQVSNDNEVWQNINGATSNSFTTPVLNADVYYRATYTCDGNTDCGTMYSTVQAMTINSSPTANAGADENLCRFFSTNLNASASGGAAPYNYSWSHAPGTGNNKVVSPLNTTTYFVTVTSNNGCNDIDQVTITVNDCYEICGNGIDDDGDGNADCDDPDCGPSVDLGSNLNNCVSTDITLTATAWDGDGAYSFAWSHGLGTGNNKTVAPATTTTYSVTVTSGSGCTATDQVTVTIVPCSENCYNNIDDDGDGLVDCDDPDCNAVAAPQLSPDVYTTCPGIPYSNRVTYNDNNLQNPDFSIVGQPTHGTVTIDETGKFIYTPSGLDCTTDNFVYQVCNQLSGCCATTTVDITLGDNTFPVLTNVPADLTISCDDIVPDVPTVTGFDECPGLYITYQESSDQHYLGACESYTITRTWTAEDFCGNQVSQSQNISVMDLTKPEIFQVYTLENGKRLVAGVSQRVTNHWKYVPFPITFDAAPIILSQVTTNNDQAAVVTRQRNATMQGFELRLSEEEAADGVHNNESVSWIAIEPGALDGNMELVAGTFANVGDEWATLNYGHSFGSAPQLFASIITDKEMDAAEIRYRNLNGNSAELFIQEEKSADAEILHADENISFIALGSGQRLFDRMGTDFGESGSVDVNHAWKTISLANRYTKPVVICGGMTMNGGAAATVRVRNVTSTSFEVRVQEWDYLDGNHSNETLSWMVIEGSIPGNQGYYCSGNSVNNLQPNVNVFALDNCDDIAAFGYQENETNTGNGLLTTRTWMAIDDCGNTALVSRFDTCLVAAVRVKSMLYGAVMNTVGTTMRDDLRAKEIIPIQEPYSEMNSFSHVEYQHEEADNQGSNEPMITICMDENGTPTTMEVKKSELQQYLNSGALVGDCADNPNGKVTICHNAGEHNQRTITVSQNALITHLNHGDECGPCTGDGNNMPQGAANAAYKTVANGNWSDPATWENGNVPPYININNTVISITNHVTVQSSDIKLKNGSELYLTMGSLTMENGDFETEQSAIYIENSIFDGSNAGSFRINKSGGKLIAKNSEIYVGQNFTNKGTRILDEVKLDIGESWYSDSGLDSLRKVCAVIDNNFSNSGGAITYMEDVKINLTYGSFWSAAGSEVTGSNLTLLTENGSLSNSGSWDLDISQYCVSDSLLLPNTFLPSSSECVDIVNFFNPCECNHEVENTVGNNNTNANEPVITNEEVINAGNSQGNGELDPALLEVTGDAAIVDWVLVELRDELDDENIVGYATVGLQRDGNVITEDGDDVIVFPGLGEGNYYVALRHRNHLGVMTDDPFYLSSNDVPFIDFSDPALEVRGGAIAGRISNGKRLLWAGDFNEDGKVVYQGPYNDVFFLFSRILADPSNQEYLANFIINEYDINDVNLDGRVIYQGPNNDRAPLLYHSILSHPSNSSFLANYIVSGKLP